MAAVPRILITFDNEQLYLKVLSRLRQNKVFHVEGIEQLVLFNSDANVRRDFGKGWVNIHQQLVNL